MDEAKFVWRERTSESEFVASVWACSTPAAMTRTVLADPCISLAFVKDSNGARVILAGPQVKPDREPLAPGYTCTTIRLQPGVLLQNFPTQRFINSSLVLSVDSRLRFWFEGTCLQFPDFDQAEVLIDQLYNLGYLSHDVSNNPKVLSPRTYSRLIKRTTGLSPYRLHQLQRIHQALRLLKQGVPAVTVAAELDFVDQAHLTHTSRQFLGHTPRQLLRLPQIP